MKKKNIILTGVILASCLFASSCKNEDIKEETVTSIVTSEKDSEFTLSFVTNCDLTVDSMQLESGSSVASPQLSRKGYQFKGWFTDEALTTPFKNKMPSRNLTVYAGWEANRHVITFDMDGGEAVSAIAVKYGEKITLPSVFDKDGYHFAGWDKEVPETMPDYDISLTAQWIKNSYTITFDSNGGTTCHSLTYEYGDEISYPVPEREGYTFKGWSGEYAYVTMPSKDLSFTAEWEAEAYTIEYVLDGGSLVGELETYTILDEFIFQSPEKEGYTFIGWYTEDGIKMDGISKGTMGNIRLYAKYEIKSHTFTYDYDDGENPVSVTYSYGETITIPSNPSKEGYTFTGWNAKIPQTMPDNDISIKALWKINSHTITFDTDGGTKITSMTLDYGTKVDAPANPEKKGYAFKGWSVEIPDSMPDSDLTIKALWEVAEYSISYDLDGGTLENLPLTYSIENPVDLSSFIPEKGDNEFTGWIDENGNVITSTEGFFQNLQLTATWNVVRYNVNYVFIDNKDNSLLTVDLKTNPTFLVKDNPAIALIDVSLDGYQFGGFYSDSSFKNLISEIPASCNSEITIYGYFRKKFSITYDMNDGTDTGTVTYGYHGDPVVMPMDPSRNGYQFTGWDKEVSTYEEDVTIKATWGCMFTQSNGIITGVTSYLNGIASVTIPDKIDGVTITQLGDGKHTDVLTSSYASSLREVIIPDTVTVIYGFFFESSPVTSVTIGKGVTTIGFGAFTESAIESIVIPSNVTEVGESAFQNCTSLTDVTCEAEKQEDDTYLGVTTMGESCFHGCTKLVNVTLPESLTSMGENAFANCTSLKTMTLPSSLVDIGYRGFYNCTSLEYLSLPDGFHFQNNLLENCIALKKLSMYGNLNTYSYSESPDHFIRFGTLFYYSETSEGTKENLTECVVDSTVTSYCYVPSSLTEIEIHGDAEYLEHFFSGITTITTVSFMDKGTIADYMFEDVKNLKTIHLSEDVFLYIKYESFDTSITSITVNSLSTKAEWKAYNSSEPVWNSSTISFTIICTDGTITFDADGTYKEK